jgi:transcriptional regulator with XRE-family HTH domain
VDIGARLRAARKAAGLTQEGVARRAGLTLKAVGEVERGEVQDPHYSTLTAIARALSMTVGELVGEEELVPLADASETGQPETAPPAEEESGPPVVHFAKLSDNAYEEVRENARTLEELEDLRRRVDLEYEQLSRWVRRLKEEGGAAPADIEETRELRKRLRKRREVAVFDVSEMIIAFDEKRPPRLSRTAGKTVDEAYDEIHGSAKEGASQAESWVSERHEQSS